MASVPGLSLSDESKHVIKGILESKTAETDGVLNIDELGECLDAFGFTADDEDVDFLKKHFDDNGDGELEVEELMNNIDVLNWHSFYGKRLMKEFKRIDSDGDGVIRYPEMLKIFTTKGPNPMQPKDARRLLDQLARKFDENFDGKFSYAEFVKIFMSDMLPYRDSIAQGAASSSDEEEPAFVVARREREKKKKAALKKRQSEFFNGSSSRGGTSSSTRGGARGGAPANRRSTSTTSQESTSDAPSRPKSVWDRLSQAKAPPQRRSTHH